MSYYQKYRPEKIADLDLGSARSSFEKMMAAGEMAHAYLLVGPRGSGKTSSARILARIINCEKNYKNGKLNKKLNEPCGECAACVSIKNGSAVDVMEIDAASHRGIDDIRDLRDKARLAPAALSKKVYIIDEVHMLTTEAFNALLKTLEEPPAHVMFILCTTEAHKVPETIASRCVRINFTKAGEAELIASLSRAAQGEGLEVDKEAMKLLAQSVDGSFREGHKLLEQLALRPGKITVDYVRENLNLGGLSDLESLIDYVRAGKAKEVVGVVKVWESQGVDVTSVITKLLTILQNEVDEAVKAGERVARIDSLLITKLISTVPKIKISPLPFLPLEMTLLAVAFRVNRGGKSAPTPIKVKVVSDEPREAGTVSLEQVAGGWQELLTRLTPRNHSVAGLLRSAKPKEMDDKFLTIEVFYKFHKEQLEQEARRKMIEEEIAKMWGPISVRCVLGEHATPRQASVVRQGSAIASNEEDLKAAEEVFGV